MQNDNVKNVEEKGPCLTSANNAMCCESPIQYNVEEIIRNKISTLQDKIQYLVELRNMLPRQMTKEQRKSVYILLASLTF